MTGGAGARWSPEVFAHMPLQSPGKHVLTLPRCCSYRKQKTHLETVEVAAGLRLRPTGRPVLFRCLLALLDLALCLLSALSKGRATFGHGTVVVHKIPTCYWFYFSLQPKKLLK